MTSRAFFRASIAALSVTSSLAGSSAWAQTAVTTSPVKRGDNQKVAGEELDVVTVTGSRIITDNVRSPTPITSVDIGEVALTTPSSAVIPLGISAARRDPTRSA